ncbi:MAG: hypothetical protein ABIH21_01290 [Patescibacteria group bacterium]
MSKTPNYDNKVKSILDSLEPSEQTCAMTGEKWQQTQEEIDWYKKFNVPPSKVCPQTRWFHHSFWYVGYQYWYQPHPETGKPIICTVHPATGIKVLPDKEWFEKEFQDMGRDYDSSKSFLEQWHELQLDVPMPANRNHVEPVNSIAFVSQGDENSFFVGACKSKNTLYSHLATDTESSAEIFRCDSVQKSFNVIHSYRIHNSKYLRECFDCMNCEFCFDCRNCENCYGATNKRNKKFIWMNEQLSEDEWNKRRAEIYIGSRKQLNDQIGKFYNLIKEQGVWPENFNDSVTNSSGEYLTKTVNVIDSYACEDGALNQYSCNHSAGKSEDNAFSGYPVNGSNFYYSASGSGNNQKFCFLTIRSENMEYCLLCYNCSDCFGCIGLQHKKFCILNKQYSEDKYWQRVNTLKQEMLEKGEYGEFFPIKYSPSYWEDSGGPYWFGARTDELKGLGILDYDPESEGAIGRDLYDDSKLKKLSELPDHVSDLDEQWANVPLMDEIVNRRFALIKPEIDFYKSMNIAPPDKHFITRMKDLWLQCNIGRFENVDCAECQKKLKVAINKAHSERKIYCKECYLKYLETNG